jgi:hypothetical protein
MIGILIKKVTAYLKGLFSPEAKPVPVSKPSKIVPTPVSAPPILKPVSDGSTVKVKAKPRD